MGFAELLHSLDFKNEPVFHENIYPERRFKYVAVKFQRH